MICIFTPNEKWSYYDPNAPIHPAWSTNKNICLIVGTEIFPRYFQVKFVALICIVLSIFYFASSPVLYVRAARLLFLCFRISLKRDLKERKSEGKKSNHSICWIFRSFCMSFTPFPGFIAWCARGWCGQFVRTGNPFWWHRKQTVVW